MDARPLARELRLPAAFALVVGQVIGVGIFLTPGTIIRTVASPAGVLLVWLVMGLIVATVASVFVLRRRDPTFHVPGHPWTALLFLSLGSMLLLLLGASNPLQALLGLLVVAAALPVYRLVQPDRTQVL